MRTRVAALVVAALLALCCLGVTSLGAALALRQPDVETLVTSTRSKLAADYSADPHDFRLPPLNPGIIDDSRKDARDLASTSSSPALVPVGGATSTPTTEASAASPTAVRTATGASQTPRATPSRSATGIAGEPTNATATAQPTVSNATPTPERTNGTPTPTPVMKDTPTPVRIDLTPPTLPSIIKTPTPTATATATKVGTPAPTRTPLPAAALSISPFDQTVSVGSATVSITVKGAISLGSYDITISWNPLVLAYAKAANGAFLASTGNSVNCQPAVANLLANTVRLRCSTSGSSGVSGSGTLASVQFTTLVSGTSAIQFASATLTSTQGAGQPVTTTSGSVTYKLLGILSLNAAAP